MFVDPLGARERPAVFEFDRGEHDSLRGEKARYCESTDIAGSRKLGFRENEKAIMHSNKDTV